MKKLFSKSRMILSIAIIGIASLVGIAQTAEAVNLLQDPGFDTKPNSTWTGELRWSNVPWFGLGGGVGGNSGGLAIIEMPTGTAAYQLISAPKRINLHLYGTEWAYALAGQKITTGIAAGKFYTASAYFKRTATDMTNSEGLFKVEWLNSSNAVIRADEGKSRFDQNYVPVYYNSWYWLKDIFVAPTGAVAANYYIIYRKSATTTSVIRDIYLDSASFEETPNLFSQPNFDGLPDGELYWSHKPWYGYNGGVSGNSGGVAVVKTSSLAKTASKVINLHLWGKEWAYALVGQDLSTGGIIVGKQYIFSAYLLRTADITDSEAFLKVEWINSSNNVIRADEGVGRFNKTTAPLTNTWYLMSETFTAPGISIPIGARCYVIYRKPATAASVLRDVFVDNTSFVAK